MSATPKKAPYGTWKSPVTTDVLLQKLVLLEGVLTDDVTREIYHIERRPSEAGRSVLVRSGDETDVMDQSWNVRTSVHEYGGGAATVSDGLVYFSNFKDRRVYRTQVGKLPEPVTPENANWRYADFAVVKANPRFLIAVLEDHTKPDPSTVANKLVAIDTISQTIETIAEGADFYKSPGISHDGGKISWIQWHHPDMPWEGSELVVGEIVFSGTSIKVINSKVVAGHKGEISVDQPQWISAETMLFLNDASGFMNPWSYSTSSLRAGSIIPKPIDEDFAGPAWQFKASDYAVLDSDTVLFASTRHGCSVLSLVDLHSGSLKNVATPYVVIAHLRAVSSHEAVFIGKKDDEPAAVIRITVKSDNTPAYTVVKSTSSSTLPRDIISKAVSYSLPVPPSNEPVHVLYYAPFNPAFAPLDGETPPAIIAIHGGPTSHTSPGLDWGKQFWTSRGWAWVEVNYGGSSGYGRKYRHAHGIFRELLVIVIPRERLRGKWGIVDVNDSVEAVKQLSERKLIDSKRTAIRGGSAGGYTVLASVTSRPNVFAAATSLYGVSDLAKFVQDTHKFESRYLEKLIGGTVQQDPELYKDRSPITHADKIVTPLLILQGSIDAVVPPAQAESIVQIIEQKGGRVKYILFEGEGHGWRKAENIKMGLEAEVSWYESVFGLVRKHDAAL